MLTQHAHLETDSEGIKKYLKTSDNLTNTCSSDVDRSTKQPRDHHGEVHAEQHPLHSPFPLCSLHI